jgi:hypothetical protein
MAYTAVLKERRSAGTLAPSGVAVYVQLAMSISVQLPTRHLRIAEATVFLEDLDLSDRDALRVKLNLTTLWSGVDDLGFAFHLD